MNMVTFKTLALFFNAILAILLVAGFGFLVLFTLIPFTNNPAILYVLIIGAFMAAIYAAAFLTKSTAEITVAGGQLTLRVHNEWRNRTTEKVFPLHDLSAFEIVETQLHRFLVLYRSGRSPALISIADEKDVAPVVELLKPVLKLTDKHHPLSGKTFGRAYLTAVKNIFIPLLLSLVVFSAALSAEYRYHSTFEINYTYRWSWLVIFLLSIFLFNRLHNISGFRVEGKYVTSYLMAVFYCYLAFFVPPGLLKVIGTPVETEQFDKAKNPQPVFVRVKNVVTDTSRIGLYFYKRVSKNSRSNRYNHYLAAPVFLGNQLPVYQYWIAESYSQKISGSYSTRKRGDVFNTNLQSFRKQFKSNLLIPPAFFELVHNDAGTLIKDKNYRSAVDFSSAREFLPKIFIRHTEPFEQFRAAQIKKVVIITASFTTIFLLLALAAAYYR